MTPHELAVEFANLLRKDETIGLSDGQRRHVAGLLAMAGARLPVEVVTTIERFRELPVQAIVRTSAGNIFQRWAGADEIEPWEMMASSGVWSADEIGLPVEVIA